MSNQSNVVPQHVAIIMDGNGRWAQAKGKRRSAGHKAGVETTRATVENAVSLGIKHLTLFAFSTENWHRPEEEVTLLMELFLVAIGREVNKLHENNVRICFVGNTSDFSDKLQLAMRSAEEKTAENTALKLNIAVSYGGRADITQAVKQIANRVKSGDISPDAITEADISGSLYLAGSPDPDLFIRTGGESRLSNFLLWNLAYSELVFLDVLWPDFDKQEFSNALEWFVSRQRRFGKTGEQVGV